MAIIKTPDQRVRVFISSTINELAEERKATREAISNLRLIPVFFEAGARPHPPRDLYSAYLDQSHIFLGIYWNSYGWIAPGAEISGLEDEYRLCGNKPKLIYVKRSSDRQEKLNALLRDIESSDTACYQMFDDAAELRTLIENDLSVLMSEAFENALFSEEHTAPGSDPPPKHKRVVKLPLIRGEIIGRDDDIDAVSVLLLRPDVSLISLLGAGGTGKTMLSTWVAHRIKDQFRDGVIFVPLAPVTDHRLLPVTIADLLDLQDSGKQSVDTTLLGYLTDKQMLLVLDNFEQIIDAARLVSDITLQCPGIKILVTSRTSLHIRNERIYNLGTLAVPDSSLTSEAELLNVPSSRLFIERALTVNPNLPLNADNVRAIIEICQRLDGLPLAIELAAARTKFFQPAALMLRIEKTLDLVSKGHKDLPERQQTLRGAIEWSYNLLAEDTRKVFRQLGVFKRSWTLEAADAVVNGSNGTTDLEEMTERLLDVSLIKLTQAGQAHEPRFSMLQTVHEYADEMLAAAPEAGETRLRYAEYYYRMLEETEWILWKVTSEPWLDRIEYEMQNIRAAFHTFIALDKLGQAWDMFSAMLSYWALRGGFTECMDWIKYAGIDQEKNWSSEDISLFSRGRTLTLAALAYFTIFRFEDGFRVLQIGEQLLEQTDHEAYIAMAYVLQGCYGTFLQMPNAPEKLEAGKALAEKCGHPLILSIVYLWSYEYYRQQGRMDIIAEQFAHIEEIAAEHDYLFMLVSLFSIRYSLLSLNENNDYTQIAGESGRMLAQMPEKGYKSLKAVVYGASAYCMLKLDRMEEAEQYLMNALEYARESGEKEAELYRCAETALLFAMKGDHEKASRILGAAEGNSASTGYPLVGTSGLQCAEARDRILQAVSETAFRQWHDEGQKMPLEKALAYAMAEE